MLLQIKSLFLLFLATAVLAMPAADEEVIFKSPLGNSGPATYTIVPSAKEFDDEFVSYEPIESDDHFVSYEPVEQFKPRRSNNNKFKSGPKGNFRLKEKIGGPARPEDNFPPQPYQFEYGVRDHDSGADFQAAESQDPDGNVIGSYRVNLPDGRVQTVTYRADEHGGFKADVSYEGEASYPPEPEGGYAAAYKRRTVHKGPPKKYSPNNNKFKNVDISQFEYE